MDNRLKEQPLFGIFNADQSKFLVTSNEDILFVDMRKKLEIDIDEQEGIDLLQQIIAVENEFYVMANKQWGQLGYFIFSFDIEDPTKPAKYLINWTNGLEIANCDMHYFNENG